MAVKGQYKVTRYIGAPVEADSSGQYHFKKDPDGNVKVHDWRTGKHSRGKFKGIGQIFLTENDLPVAVIASAPVRFNHRHAFTPMQRFTTAFVDTGQVQALKKALNL